MVKRERPFWQKLFDRIPLLFFYNRPFNYVQSLLTVANILWFMSWAYAHYLGYLVIHKQYFYGIDGHNHEISRGAFEIYAVLIAVYVTINQTHLWTGKKEHSRRGELFWIFWMLIVFFSLYLSFFEGKPFAAELVWVIIGMAVLYLTHTFLSVSYFLHLVERQKKSRRRARTRRQT